MKAFVIIATLTILTLLTLLWVGSSESEKELELRQKEIDGLLEKNLSDEKQFQQNLDSIRNKFKERIDSMTVAHEKTIAANQRSQREIKTLKSIIFVAHSDSSRTKELRNLYKSYQ